MARAKRSAYIIRIYTYNTHGAIKVSKKEFEQQLRYYSGMVDRQRKLDQDDEYSEVEFAKTRNKWDEKSIAEVWIFADRETEIHFTKITAKPGYRIA